MNSKPISVARLTISLAPLVLAVALSMDVYVPAIPQMTKIFHTSDDVMLLTLNLFMLTSGIVQIFVGPISDSFGRKSVAIAATLIYAAGTIACALSPTPVSLILFRILQSIGACAMIVVGLAIVRDCFSGDKSARVYSYLNGIISFSPMFAPFLGSYLDIHYGWQATFLSLLSIAILSLISLLFFLPETLDVDKRKPLALDLAMANYKQIFKNRLFNIYTLLSCFGLSYLYLFCALSPYLIIRDLKVNEIDYGFYFFYMGVSFFIGSFLCGFIVTRIGIYKACIIGSLTSLIGGLLMALWFMHHGLTIHGFIYPMLLVGIGGTFCLSAGNGGAMEPFNEDSGSASALGGTLRFLFSSFTGYLVINDNVASTLPLGIPAILFSAIGLGLLIKNKKSLVL